MEQEPKRGGTGDKQNNSSLVWFALAIVVALSVISFLLLNQKKESISYSDFQDLIAVTKYHPRDSEKAGELVDGWSGKLVIVEEGENGRTIEYSEPHLITVGKEIKGSIYYQVLKGCFCCCSYS